MTAGKPNTLKLSEKFGPTVQGEGPNAGRLCAFIRLGLCNLNCSWCDTPYTWDWTGDNGHAYDRTIELTDAKITDLVAWAESLPVEHVVITGGEPLVQRRQHAALVIGLTEAGFHVETETNGTIVPHPILTDNRHRLSRLRWNVSPKLAGSGVDHRRTQLNALSWFAGQSDTAVFKFVIVDRGDVVEALRLIDSLGVGRDRVWLMPEGVTGLAQIEASRWVADAAVESGCNFTSRLHVLAWGDERGR